MGLGTADWSFGRVPEVESLVAWVLVLVDMVGRGRRDVSDECCK
jgi:hypothetical protein